VPAAPPPAAAAPAPARSRAPAAQPPELPNAGRAPPQALEPWEGGAVVPASMSADELAHFGAAHVRLWLGLEPQEELRLLMVGGGLGAGAGAWGWGLGLGAGVVRHCCCQRCC
jgi:hypothetical protein